MLKIKAFDKNFIAVLNVCLNAIQLEDETFISVNKLSERDEAFEDIMDIRYYYCKILKYIGACINIPILWPVLSIRIKQDIDAVTAAPNVPTGWAKLEASLTCLSELLICKFLDLFIRFR